MAFKRLYCSHLLNDFLTWFICLLSAWSFDTSDLVFVFFLSLVSARITAVVSTFPAVKSYIPLLNFQFVKNLIDFVILKIQIFEILKSYFTQYYNKTVWYTLSNMGVRTLTRQIHIREYRRGNQKWTIQRNWHTTQIT